MLVSRARLAAVTISLGAAASALAQTEPVRVEPAGCGSAAVAPRLRFRSRVGVKQTAAGLASERALADPSRSP